jgi:hypothetical protein
MELFDRVSRTAGDDGAVEIGKVSSDDDGTHA